MYHIAGYFRGGNNNSRINPKRVSTIQMAFKTLEPLNKNSTKITHNTVHTLLSYDKKETANTPQKQEGGNKYSLSLPLSLLRYDYTRRTLAAIKKSNVAAEHKKLLRDMQLQQQQQR